MKKTALLGFILTLTLFLLGVTRTSVCVDVVEASMAQEAAPDFSLTDIDGNSFSLSDYCGTVVLLEFFATYCSPSVNQTGRLKILYEEFGEKLVLISTSPENETVLRDFRDNYNISWTIAKDTSGVFGAYNIQYLPTLVIIDQQGYICYTHVGLTEESVLRPEIESLLPKTIYVDDDNVAGPWNGTEEHPYQNITSGLEHASDGDTVFVQNGTYYENVVVTKSVAVFGENKNTTVIVGVAHSPVWESVISVWADDVKIANLTVRNGGEGICLFRSKRNTVTDCVACENKFGLTISESSQNFLRRNLLFNNSYNLLVLGCWSIDDFIQDIDPSNYVNGKPVYYLVNEENVSINPVSFPDVGYLGVVNSSNVQIANLSLSRNGNGLLIAFSPNTLIENVEATHNHYGISLMCSLGTIVKHCNFSHNSCGMFLYYSDNVNIKENNISHNEGGIYLIWSSYNAIYHNNFVENYRYHQVSVYKSYGTCWDDGYPSGGNYWSDYSCTDFSSGHYQNETDSDCIGDASYVIDGNNEDNYPLMGMFHSYRVPPYFGYDLAVTIVSNSTVSDFSVARVVPVPIINFTSFSLDDWKETSETRLIMFNATGETGLGFCRLCIPKTVMVPPYTVAINRGPASPIYYNEALFDNGTHRWIYFTYLHSITHEIWIMGQEDKTAPVIANVTQQPANVYPNDNVIVYANVTDDQSGVKDVILNYTTNNGTWFTVEMTKLEGDLYNATIPEFPCCTNVTYVIIAEDNVDNNITTKQMGYDYQYHVVSEFSSVIVMPLFMIATLLAVIVYRRNLMANRVEVSENAS